jgi:hypothetical protein
MITDQYGSCIPVGYFRRDIAITSRERVDRHLIFATEHQVNRAGTILSEGQSDSQNLQGITESLPAARG